MFAFQTAGRNLKRSLKPSLIFQRFYMYYIIIQYESNHVNFIATRHFKRLASNPTPVTLSPNSRAVKSVNATGGGRVREFEWGYC
jgi:hypothetical protein